MPSYVITDVLGGGRSCSVYLGHYQDTPAEDRVIKIFKCIEDYQSEAEALTKMMTVPGDTRVPIIHDRNEERRVLVVGPVGSPVRPVSGGRPVCGQQLADLVQPLETAHHLGIVHRKVESKQIFLHGKDRLRHVYWTGSAA